MAKEGVFWDDHARDRLDPEFLREYAMESRRIATIDAVVNALDDRKDEQKPKNEAAPPVA